MNGRIAPRAALAAAGLLTAVACGPAGAEAGASAGVTELEQVVPFGADDLLHDVRDVAVDDSGRVWVLAGMEPFVRIYSADGALVRRFGRPGGGPGEVRNPWSLFVTGDAAAPVGVWDVGNRRLVTYSAAGAPVGTTAVDVTPGVVRADIRDIAYGSVSALRGWGSSLLLQDEPRGVIEPAALLHSRLVKLDRSGRTEATVVDFGERHHRQTASLGMASALVPVPLWAICPESRLVVLDPFTPALEWYDAAGRPQARLAVQVPQRRLGEDDIRAYLSHVVGLETRGAAIDPDVVEKRVEQIARSQRHRFPRNAPPAVSLLCDSRGQVWLQQFSTADHPLGYGREWIVVDPRGASRRVRFPPGFQPRAFTRAAAVGVRTDSLDVQQIATVPL
ncbi:MAG TPA: hypothetical protein VF142_21970 [Longimicrobium sp.]